jgi:hypothetical protein
VIGSNGLRSGGDDDKLRGSGSSALRMIGGGDGLRVIGGYNALSTDGSSNANAQNIRFVLTSKYMKSILVYFLICLAQMVHLHNILMQISRNINATQAG